MDQLSCCQQISKLPVGGFLWGKRKIDFWKSGFFAWVFLMSMFAFSQQSYSQGLGDPIFIEDFGSVGDGSAYHSYDDQRVGTGGRPVYFKDNGLPYINSIDFFTPFRWSSGDPYRDNRIGIGPTIASGVSYNGTMPSSVSNGNWGPVFKNGTNNTNSLDGVGGYSLINDSRGYYQSYLGSAPDHSTGDFTGYMLVVDAHSSTTLYFDRVIDDLCAGTKFRFSVWIKDLNNQGSAKPQVKFKIYNADTYVSATSSVGLIGSKSTSGNDVTPANTWKQLFFDFEMPAGVSSVRLQIENIVGTQYGNDLAIDDISFAPIGPEVLLSGDAAVCPGSDPGLYATITESNSDYRYPGPLTYFQLQYRLPGTSNWSNIGDVESIASTSTDDVVFPNPYSDINVVLDNTKSYEFRVLVAGDEATLDSPYCRSVSEKLVSIYEHKVELTASPNEVCAGSDAVITSSLTQTLQGASYVYTWEKLDGTTWSVVTDSDNDDTQLTLTNLQSSSQFRLTVAVNGDECDFANTTTTIDVFVAQNANAGPDQNQCGNGTFTLAGNEPGAGESGTWTFVGDAHGAFISDVNLFNTSVSGVPVGQSVTLRWTLSSTEVSGCISTPDDIVLTNNAIPAAPIGTTYTVKRNTGSYDFLATLSNPSNTLRWYDNATGGTPLASTPSNNSSVLGSFNKYVSEVNAAGCESPRVKATINVESDPDFPECTPEEFNCTTNNLNFPAVYLSDVNGTPITNKSCTIGSSQEVYIAVNIQQNSNTTRYYARLFASLYIGDNPVPISINTSLGNINSGSQVITRVLTDSFNWECGDALELKNILVVWKTNPNQIPDECDDYNPAQSECAPSIFVTVPLSIDFNYEACTIGGSTTVNFTSVSNGGFTPYTYEWDFDNNGTVDSTDPNPSHVYTSGSSANVKLTLKDSDSPVTTISTTKTVNFPSDITPTLTIVNPTCSNDKGSFSFVRKQGVQYSLASDFSVLIDGSTVLNLPAGSSGTLYVRSSVSCTTSVPYTIGDQPLPPAVPVISVVDPTCSDPSGSASIVSPVAGVEYSLSNSFAVTNTVFGNLSPGNYTIFARTIGTTCVSSESFVIDTPPTNAPAPVAGPTLTVCEGSDEVEYSISPSQGYTLIYYESNDPSAAPLSGVPTVNPETSGIGTFSVWVSQVKDGQCESERVNVSVEVVNCGVSISKIGEFKGNGECTEVGDPIEYTFTVTNTGVVKLTNVTVSELSFSGTNGVPSIAFVSSSANSPQGTLEPGEVAIYKATYLVSQEDIEVGKVENQAQVNADAGTLNLESISGSGFDFGEWNLIVRNNVTNSSEVEGSALIGGNLSGTSNYSISSVTASNGAGLMVGGNVLSGSIQINQGGDFYLGGSVSGTINMNGGTQFSTTEIPSLIGTAFAQANALSSYLAALTTTGTIDGGGNMSSATTTNVNGEEVAVYALTQAAFSGGQLNLNFGSADVVIINFDASGNGGVASLNAPPNLIGGFTSGQRKIIWNFINTTQVNVNNSFEGMLLAPNANLNHTGGQINGNVIVDNISNMAAEIHDYIFNAGLTNVGQTGQSGKTVVELCQTPSLMITKTVDPTNISSPSTLTYTISVTNEGNVSLTGVVVTDPFTDGVTPLVLDSGDTDNDGELDLDETWVYYASYEADQDDVDAGDDIVNTAYVNSNETEEEEA
ncbi:collagen-binding domain-containing protein, partial [Algoriphagus vanfongensis]|uniref:collagen-binding domain-containing protein n=1 Tax=Algoriphagus vanfongensis TaxID=426371 RepID=UPI000478AC9D